MNKQSDIFWEILSKFIEDFSKNNRCSYSAILDGSVNNKEQVYGLSDIDLKIFADSKIINQDFFKSISDSIETAIDKEKIIFNLWVLSTEDFPDKEDGVYFDFVRRFVLRNGRLLFGRIDLNTIQLKKEINRTDRDLCIKTIVGFLIRLRRLLTNPTAISGVQRVSKRLLLQQGISYYFHFLRYHHAFQGQVVLRIKDNLDLYVSNNSVPKVQKDFAKKVFTMRKNWKETLQTHNNVTALVFLSEIVQQIEFVLDNSLRPNLSSKNKPIIYYP